MAAGAVKARGGAAGAGAGPRAAGRGLVAGGRAYREVFRVRAGEVDPHQRLRPGGLLAVLQEAAVGHVEALFGAREGAGFPVDPLMEELELTYVLTKMGVRYRDACAGFGSAVQVDTWFQPLGKAGLRRDWVATDAASGEELAVATSTWVLVNLKTRRMARIPPELMKHFDVSTPEEPRGALELPKGGAWAGAAGEEAEDPADALQRSPKYIGPHVTATFQHIDANRHVSNLFYMDWLLSALPEGRSEGSRLVELDMDYKSEILLGDGVRSLAVESAGSQGGGETDGGGREFLHVLTERGTDKEFMRARTRWVPETNACRAG